MMKRYIYVTKCKEEKLVFNNYMLEIYQIEKIEKLIALRNDKMNYHNRKWKVFIV